MTPTEREQWARQICIDACRLELKRAVTLEEVQAVQVISRLESTYGDGWSQASGGKGSNNWGAIQFIATSARDLCNGSFVTTDHHRDGTAYRYPYCTYASPLEGCRHVVRLLERMGALDLARTTRRLRAVSAQLGRKGYYEGTGKNLTEAQRNHFVACLRNFAVITAACNDTGKGLNNADTETPLTGPTYLEDESRENEAEVSEDAPSSGGESAGGDSEASEEAPSEETSGPPDPVNPWPEEKKTMPATPEAIKGSHPLEAPGAKWVALVVAILTAVLTALQCSGCTPAELQATRAIVRDAAVVGLDVCLLIEEVSDHPNQTRRKICTDGQRLMQRLDAAQSADQMSRGMAGAGGAGP